MPEVTGKLVRFVSCKDCINYTPACDEETDENTDASNFDCYEDVEMAAGIVEGEE